MEWRTPHVTVSFGTSSLALATIQPTMGQRDSLVEGAVDAYLHWHPQASFEDRDSIQQLLQDWQMERTYFALWPCSDYDLIPFLSPTSAFNLSRYVSETGTILDVKEWRATGLSQAEQAWMKTFFQTGYPKRLVQKPNRPAQIDYNEPLPDGTPKGSTTDWSLAPYGAWEACGSNSSSQLLLAGVFMGHVTLGAFSPFMGDIIATNSIHRFDFPPSM